MQAFRRAKVQDEDEHHYFQVGQDGIRWLSGNRYGLWVEFDGSQSKTLYPWTRVLWAETRED